MSWIEKHLTAVVLGGIAGAGAIFYLVEKEKNAAASTPAPTLGPNDILVGPGASAHTVASGVTLTLVTPSGGKFNSVTPADSSKISVISTPGQQTTSKIAVNSTSYVTAVWTDASNVQQTSTLNFNAHNQAGAQV